MDVKKYQAKKFDPTKLPEPAGVSSSQPFDEILGIKIPSRDIVADKLAEFIEKTKQSKSALISVIKAEWGEGKTDAYERFITKKLDDQNCHLVSTSTILNRLEKIKSESDSGNTATNLLAATFASIGDDIYSRHNTKHETFYIEKVNDPVYYSKKVLQETFAQNKKNLYIFIDEFEEIIHSNTKIQVISGIKEIYNQLAGIISTKGEFAGRVHFFIACTPFAWNQIASDPDIINVVGGSNRRLVPNLIELPSLTKKDSYNFLINLFKHVYGNDFEELPIASEGVFETMVNLSYSNPGNLIQIFSKLMNGVQTVDNSTIRRIDFEQILKDLAHQPLSVFGAVQNAVHEGNLSKFQNILISEECVILNLLLGEQKAFELSELTNRLGIQERNITDYVNQINQKLEDSANLTSSIQMYNPIKPTVDFDAVVSSLPTTSNGKNIVIDDQEIEVNTFREVLSHYQLDLKSCKYQEILLVPKNPNEFAKLLSLDLSRSQKLHNMIFRRCDSTKKYYLPSEDIKENIFPSPKMAKFNFIKDDDKKLSIRRSVQKTISEPAQRQNINQGLTSAIINANAFVSAIGKNPISIESSSNCFNLSVTVDIGEPINIPVLIEGVFETITDAKINEIRNKMNSTPALLTILFHVQTLSEETVQKLENVGQVLPIPIENITAEQLLAWKKATSTSGVDLHPPSERLILNQIIDKINIKKHFIESWQPVGLSKGILIPDLKELGPNLGKSDAVKDMIKCLVQTSHEPTQDQFAYYLQLSAMKLFGPGSKRGIVPGADIETRNDWMAKAEILSKYSFVNDATSPIRQIRLTSVEERILKLIEQGKNSLSALENEFSNMSEYTSAIKDFYITSLKEKGKIIERANKYEIQKHDNSELVTSITSITSDIDNIQPSPDKFLCQVKERGINVIAQSDCVRKIKALLTKRLVLFTELSTCTEEEKAGKEDEILRISTLIVTAYTYFKNTFQKIINEASTEKTNLSTEFNNNFNLTKQSVQAIVTTYNSFIDTSHAIEFENLLTDLQTLYDSFKAEEGKLYSKQAIETDVKTLSKQVGGKYKDDKTPFWFKKEHAKDANYFSLDYYRLSEISKEFEGKRGEIEQEIQQAMNHHRKIESVRTSLTTTLRGMVFPQEFVISYTFLKTFAEFDRNITPPTAMPTWVKEIKDNLDQIERNVESLAGQQATIIDNLRVLNSKEQTVFSTLQNSEQNITSLKDFILGSKFEEEFKHINNQYETLIQEFESLKNVGQTQYTNVGGFGSTLSAIKDKVTEFNTDLQKNKSDLDTIKNNLSSEIKLELDNMDKFISTCLADTQLSNENKTKINGVKDELESFRNSIKNELSGVVEL